MSSMIWIHICVRLLLFISLEVYSSSLDAGNVNPGIELVKILRQNIPIDYKIPIKYVPKTEAGMCWVTLNLYDLEHSLDILRSKFGAEASNKEDIDKLVVILQELRIQINADQLDHVLMIYQCHYQNVTWPREQYFDFFEEVLKAAQKEESIEDCYNPPECPSTPEPTTPNGTTNATKVSQPDPSPRPVERIAEMERSLFSLLFIPLIALIVLLVWRVRSRRCKDLERNPGESGPFTAAAAEGTAPPLSGEISERNNLNVSETV